MTHPLSSDSITRHLTTDHLGRTLHVLQEADSTNSVAARLAQQGAPHGTVVSAEQQTAGRGRRGRPWHGRSGHSLCFSILLRPSPPPATDQAWLAWIPLASALGVAAGIHRSTGAVPSLKWPNDLLIGTKKIGGLLCESLGSPDRAPLLIVGVGLNVSLGELDFPEDLRTTATSLSLETGAPIDRAHLLAAILNELEPQLDAVVHLELGQVRQAYRQTCATIGKRVRVELPERVQLEGIARNIADSGALLVERLRLGPGSPTPEVVEVLAGDVVHLR